MKSPGLTRTPSLQHAVALIRPTVLETKREFQKLDAAKIDFNYRPFDRLAKPIMEGIFSEKQALSQCARLRNEKSRAPNSDLVSAFCSYANDKRAGWFRQFTPDVYPIAPGIGIPLQPNGFWVDRGILKVLWVQKWKGKTLDPLQRAIFYTILQQRIFIGDDFGSAELEWVDLRAPKAKAERSVTVLNRCDFDTLSERELKQYLDILLTAFTEFAGEKARGEEAKKEREPKPAPLLELLLDR